MKRIIYRLFASALCCSLFFSNRVIYAADETVANQFVSQYDEEPQDATEKPSDNLENVEEQEQNTESSLPETNTADEIEDSSDDAETDTDTENTDAVIEESEEEQDDVPEITEEPEEKTEIEEAKKDAMELRAVNATEPTSWWVVPSDTNGIPSQINVFKKNNTYQLYLPGGADLTHCYLSWDGGATVKISGDNTSYSSGECPIPPRNSTVDYTFTYKNWKGQTKTTTYKFVTYQGSDSDEVQQVFIEIDSSGENPTMEEMDNDKQHNTTCIATVYINGVKYESAKIKGRGNATWKESVDKKPYNITLPDKINFPGVESDVTKKWSFLAECLDRSLLGNRAGYYLANQMGVGQDTTSADVWMNGEYQGCYTVTPKTDSFVKKNGYMIEQDNYKEDPVAEGGDPQFTLEGLNTHVKGWDSSYNFITVKKIGDNILGNNASGKVDESPENLEAKAGIIHDWLQVAWDAIRSEDGWNNGHYYTEYIDIESFAKMYLIQEFVKSYDICTGSIYFYRNDAREGSVDKLMAGPLWDLDNAMGSIYANTFLGDVGDRRSGEGDFIQSISNYQNYGEEYRTCIYKTIGKHNDFIDEVYYQYNQYCSIFDNLDEKLQEMADGIEDSAIMNHQKVEELGHNAGKDNHYYGSDTTLGSGDYIQEYVKTEDWYDYVANMNTYIDTRAKWFQNTWTVEDKYVIFDSNEGTGTMKAQPVFPNRDTEINVNAFVKEGYTFTGWNTKADGTGIAYSDKGIVNTSENLTLYAQWSINEYTVTFDADNGSSPLIQTVSFGNHAEKPQEDPTKPEYDFYGWHLVTDPATGETDGKSFDFENTQITQDIRLKALWISSDAIVVLGSTLELNGTISVNVYVHIPEYKINTLTATTVVNGKRIDIKGEDALHRATDLFAFSVPVAAAEIRDAVEFKLVDQNGAVVPMHNSEGDDITETGFETSVYQYVSKDKTGDELIALCDALDRYGSYAETFFEHNNDPAHLENIEITDTEEAEVKTKVASFEPTSVGSLPAGLTYEGSTLVLEGKTAIRMYFTVAPDHNIDEYTFKVGENKLTAIPRKAMYYVEVKNVPAPELKDSVSLTVTGGNTSFTINYSVLSYIRGKLNSEKEDEELLRKLCSALFFYGEAAENYFGTQR